MKTEIIFEDKDILVAYKPAGLATQTARVGQQDMVSELKNYLWQKRMITGAALGRPAPYLGVIHRLDQPVEGLLVFALNAKAAGALTEQLQEQGQTGVQESGQTAMQEQGQTGMQESGQTAMQKQGQTTMQEQGQTGMQESGQTAMQKQGQIGKQGPEGTEAQGKRGMLHKKYYGVVCGKPDREEEELVDYLYKNKENRAVIVEDSGKAEGDFPAKKAVLKYHVLQVTERPQPLTLVDIHIFTGRFHQIRAQMAHRGMPLLGDMKYGGESAKASAKELYIPDVALCAYSLEFVHPGTGREIGFQIKPKGRAFSFFSQ